MPERRKARGDAATSITRPKGIVGTKLSEAFHAVFSFGKSGDVSTGRGAGIAKPSKPLRISVQPVASQTREPAGTGIMADQRLDHAPQHRRIRAGIGTDAMAARDHLDPADADLRGWLAAGAGTRPGRRRLAWRQHCGLFLIPRITPPAEQQARMEAMPTRNRRHRGRRLPRLRQDRALLRRRPGSACAGHHNVRRGHRSRHGADTALTRDHLYPASAITRARRRSPSAYPTRRSCA